MKKYNIYLFLLIISTNTFANANANFNLPRCAKDSSLKYLRKEKNIYINNNDYDNAFLCLQQASTQNDPISLYELGTWFEKEKNGKSFASYFYTGAAFNGSKRAQKKLKNDQGNFGCGPHNSRKQLRQSYEMYNLKNESNKAFVCLNYLAQKNDGFAEYQLSQAYIGINTHESMVWLNRAVFNGNQEAKIAFNQKLQRIHDILDKIDRMKQV